jgi:hypothetical protein
MLLTSPPAIEGPFIVMRQYVIHDQRDARALTEVSHLNFAAMGAADARYDRFSVLTDFIYMDLGGTAAHFRSVNFPNRPAIPIQAGTQSSQSLNLNNTIWTLAGGYTLAEGAWGNFDAIAGFRLFQVSARVNYSLGLTIVGPRGNGATFGGIGSVSGSRDIWNGIGGFRGRIRVGDAGLFIPYYSMSARVART